MMFIPVLSFRAKELELLTLNQRDMNVDEYEAIGSFYCDE